MAIRNLPWLKSERVPQSIEEARSLGWNGPCFDFAKDGESGEAMFWKQIDQKTVLRFHFPFTANLRFTGPSGMVTERWVGAPGPKPRKLFDVTYSLPNRSIQALAFDKNNACDVAASHANLQFIVTRAKSVRRNVPLFNWNELVEKAGKRSAK